MSLVQLNRVWMKYIYGFLIDLDKWVPGYPLPGLSASIPITRFFQYPGNCTSPVPNSYWINSTTYNSKFKIKALKNQIYGRFLICARSGVETTDNTQ